MTSLAKLTRESKGKRSDERVKRGDARESREGGMLARICGSPCRRAKGYRKG
jgi:hypothetical protein